ARLRPCAGRAARARGRLPGAGGRRAGDPGMPSCGQRMVLPAEGAHAGPASAGGPGAPHQGAAGDSAQPYCDRAVLGQGDCGAAAGRDRTVSGEIEMLLRGVLLGIAVAAPVGPIGVLCIQRSMAAGFWAGFSGGIGTALAVALYATLAAAGLAALAGVTEGMAGQVLRWAGAAFIAWLGWRTMLAPAATRAAESGREERPWRLL